mgnify:CR=1 FL=1
MTRIDQLFAAKRAANQKALILFLTAGYPDLPTSIELAIAAAESGADIIEFGVPFSDPIADGPTIQRSSMIALERGADLMKILQGVGEFRQRSTAPLVLMGAFNPIFHRGAENTVAACAQAGADGFILPDVPPEESSELEAICASNEMNLIHLIAPTSPLDRRRLICQRSQGFVYYMSLKGTTGARASLPADVARQLDEIRSLTNKPVAVGFGISTPEHVRTFAPHADAVVVGSAFINLVTAHENQPDLLNAARDYVKSLAEALK